MRAEHSIETQESVRPRNRIALQQKRSSLNLVPNSHLFLGVLTQILLAMVLDGLGKGLN